MKHFDRFVHASSAVAAALCILSTAASSSPLAAAASGYVETALVADQNGVAHFFDPRLVNPWGIAKSPDGLLVVADNGKGVSTVYPPSGIPIPFTVHIPPPLLGATDTAAPSGVVFNPSSAFVIAHGAVARPARFLYATEDGTISGWNAAVLQTSAILVVDRSSHGSVYKGIAIGHSANGDVLYATDFHNRRVDMFDAAFAILHAPGAFEDPELPLEYSPFGIRVIDDQVFVTYAKLYPPANHDDEAGPGHGFIDVFHQDGAFVKRLVSHGALDSPWGLAIAPANFGQFSSALLVGNFGDGTIHAYDRTTGALLGALGDGMGHALTIDGLWGLEFDAVPFADQPTSLYFTSGPNGESDGLLGLIRAQHSAP